MPRKLFSFTAAAALLGFGLVPLFAIQMNGAQMPATGQSEQNQKSADAEMMAHQKEMQDLSTKLDSSFQVMVAATDSRGYVHDKAIVKLHEADIKALRNAVREHKLFLDTDDHQCSAGTKQADAMMQHQQEMKGVLYDVVDTFDTYQTADDSSIESSEPVEDALHAHRDALKEFTAAIAQHQVAMTQMMKACA
jgi:hypothetical protein